MPTETLPHARMAANSCIDEPFSRDLSKRFVYYTQSGVITEHPALEPAFLIPRIDRPTTHHSMGFSGASSHNPLQPNRSFQPRISNADCRQATKVAVPTISL